MKECDDYIYFCFVTGITKIDHVNIFSGLNQLEDISRNKDYSSICGITEAELYNEFQCEILELAACNKETEEEAKSHLKRCMMDIISRKVLRVFIIHFQSFFRLKNVIMANIGFRLPLLLS